MHLRLVRSGASYTGYYSEDGQTWSTVGTVTAPGQAATQNAGLFVVSASSGSPALIGYTASRSPDRCCRVGAVRS
ncbi:hypothetical protein [Kutzneria kofuensis]|uniref:Beta-xylosidase C-terminal Concanavalin A-like domain-containing protein n=1 Tax=Kutzneria kofuensis TaxID=103725 RepID=A0A7W9KQ42_9PSEU|nr:hypothetical protein [Kutzneria kofuensis]MBB5896636.1 hypothetical protein [Kutzneria kofuensis]